MKWVEDEVKKEKYDRKDTCTTDTGMKSNVDTLNLSVLSQKCTTRTQIQPTVRQNSANAPQQLQPPSVSTSQMLKKQLQVPPPSQVILQNRMADFEDEDSYASDNGNPDSPQVGDRYSNIYLTWSGTLYTKLLLNANTTDTIKSSFSMYV